MTETVTIGKMIGMNARVLAPHTWETEQELYRELRRFAPYPELFEESMKAMEEIGIIEKEGSDTVPPAMIALDIAMALVSIKLIDHAVETLDDVFFSVNSLSGEVADMEIEDAGACLEEARDSIERHCDLRVSQLLGCTDWICEWVPPKHDIGADAIRKLLDRLHSAPDPRAPISDGEDFPGIVAEDSGGSVLENKDVAGLGADYGHQ